MVRGTLNEQARIERAHETITDFRLEQAISEIGYWTHLKYFRFLVEGAMAARDGRRYEHTAELAEALTEVLHTFHYDKDAYAKGRFEPLDLSRQKASVAIHVDPKFEDRSRESVKRPRRGHNG